MRVLAGNRGFQGFRGTRLPQRVLQPLGLDFEADNGLLGGVRAFLLNIELDEELSGSELGGSRRSGRSGLRGGRCGGAIGSGADRDDLTEAWGVKLVLERQIRF